MIPQDTKTIFGRDSATTEALQYLIKNTVVSPDHRKHDYIAQVRKELNRRMVRHTRRMVRHTQ